MIIRVELPENPTVTSQEKGIDWIHRRVYTKPAIRHQIYIYEKSIRAALVRSGIKLEGISGAVALEIRFYFATKAKRDWGEPKETKPDLDNAAKLLIDAMANVGFFKVGDQQIAWLAVRKYWAEAPSVRIDIKPYEVIRTEQYDI